MLVVMGFCAGSHGTMCYYAGIHGTMCWWSEWSVSISEAELSVTKVLICTLVKKYREKVGIFQWCMKRGEKGHIFWHHLAHPSLTHISR